MEQNTSANFRSVFELIKLMDDALSYSESWPGSEAGRAAPENPE